MNAPATVLPRIVIAEFMDETVIASLQTAARVHYDPTLHAARATLLAELATADALIVRNRTQVDREALQAAPRLRAVGRLGVGLDNLDLDGCAAAQVQVVTAGTANAASVGEYVIAAALHLLRPLLPATPAIGRGQWPREAFIGRELAGKRLGLLGFGPTARHAARLASAFGVQVQVWSARAATDRQHDPHGTVRWFDQLDQLLAATDILSVHLPLVETTRNLIGAAQLARLPEGAILIQTARGGIVDEAAVLDALSSGRLAGAALDVFNSEPPAAGAFGEPLPANLLLTPHIAGLTHESGHRVAETVAHGVLAALSSTCIPL